MMKRDTNLTDEQQRRNEEILRRLEDERKELLEETLALQRTWKQENKRRPPQTRPEKFQSSR